MPKLTIEEQKQILALHEQGLSTRQIAKEIFGDKKTRKSTIYDFLVARNEKTRTNPKILFLDIETAPSSGFYFGNRYEINISQEQVISESFILTYSAKYLGNENVIFGYLEYDDVKEENDFSLVEELYDLLNAADIVVAHNGKSFDMKVINTRLIYHGFPPPTPYKVIDTYLIAKRVFKFPSNKLDSLCQYMNLPTKISHDGFKMWKGYMHGETEAIAKMIEYNINDSIILEQLYLKLRAWDTQHPNLNVYVENVCVCPCCGSDKFAITEKNYYTSVAAYETYRCDVCGKIFKSRKNILNHKVKLTSC